MTRGILRSLAAAAATLIVLGAGYGVYHAAFCQAHRRWVRFNEQHDPVIRDDGYQFARPGDAIYASSRPIAWGRFSAFTRISTVTAHRPAPAQTSSAACWPAAASSINSRRHAATRAARAGTRTAEGIWIREASP